MSNLLRVCVGAGGQLWLDRAPAAELSPQLLPEDLVAVWSKAADIRVLGQSGTVYVLDAHTADDIRQFAPPSPFEKVVRSDAIMVGIADQRLLRSDDDGASWQSLSREPQSSIDVAVDGLGRIAVLAIPEQIWHAESLTVGRLAPLAHRSDGTTSLLVEQGQLKAVSLLHGKRPILPQSASTAAPSSPLTLNHPVAKFLTSSDFIEQRAAPFGDGYVVARRSQDGWQLHAGQLGRPLEAQRSVPGIECARIALTALGTNVWLFCSGQSPKDVTQPITVLVGADRNQQFTQMVPILMGIPNNLRVVASADSGSILLTGICPPSADPGQATASTNRDAGCRPRGLFKLERHQGETSEPAPSRFAIEPLPTPALSAPAVVMASSPSGRVIVAVAERTKTSALSLLISKNGGRNFDARSLPSGLSSGPRSQGKTPGGRADLRLTVESLSVAEDGVFSLVAKHGDHPRLFTLDSDGHLVSSADAPKGTSRMSAFDDHLVALSRSEGTLYESDDNGANFEPVAQLEPNPCSNLADCELVCQHAGCLIGNALTRLGYSHRAQPQLGLPASFDRQKVRSEAGESKTIADCEVARDGWKNLKVDGAHPSALTASHGTLALGLLATPRDEANVLVAEVTRAQRDLMFERLFSRKVAGNRAAVAVQRDHRGWVAMRIERLGISTQSIGKADFVWSNLSDRKRRFASTVLPDPVGRLSFASGSDGQLRVAPGWLIPWGERALVQMSPRGVNGEFSGYLISETQAPISVQFAGWHGIPIQLSELLKIDGQVVPVALTAQRMVLLRGAEAPAMNSAITLAAVPRSPTADANGLEAPAQFAQLGNRSGVLVRGAQEGHSLRGSHFYEIVGDDSLTREVPAIPRALGSLNAMVRCDTARRSTSERMVVDLQPGDQARIRVHSAGSPPWTLSSTRAVLYIGAEGACWDVMQAEDPTSRTSVLLFAEPGSNSWIFRTTEDMLGQSTLESATVGCHISSDAEAYLRPNGALVRN